MDFQLKSLWIMDFYMDFKSIMDYRFFMEWNGFRILKNMDYGMDMDSGLNPSGPTA